MLSIQSVQVKDPACAAGAVVMDKVQDEVERKIIGMENGPASRFRLERNDPRRPIRLCGTNAGPGGDSFGVDERGMQVYLPWRPAEQLPMVFRGMKAGALEGPGSGGAILGANEDVAVSRGAIGGIIVEAIREGEALQESPRDVQGGDGFLRSEGEPQPVEVIGGRCFADLGAPRQMRLGRRQGGEDAFFFGA